MKVIKHMHPSGDGLGAVEYRGDFESIKKKIEALNFHISSHLNWDSYSTNLKKQYINRIPQNHPILLELVEELFKGIPCCFVKSMIYNQPIWYLGIERSSVFHLIPLEKIDLDYTNMINSGFKAYPHYCSDLVSSCLNLLVGFSEMKMPISNLFLHRPIEFSQEDTTSFGFESSKISMPCLLFYNEDGYGLYIDNEKKIVKHRPNDSANDKIIADSFFSFLQLLIAEKQQDKNISQLGD